MVFSGSLQTDFFGYPSPSVNLIVDESSIEIQIFGFKKFEFFPENTLGFIMKSNGIQIKHNISKYPSFIFFRYSKPDKIAKSITSAEVFGDISTDSTSENEYQQYFYLRIVGFLIVGSIFLIGIFLILFI